nr:septal ring lytic transglycosylase RlpA family protein [Methylonatrum kenyense]
MLCGLILAACSSTPDAPPDKERDRGPEVAPDTSQLEDVVPRNEPRSRYGNPESYEVFGQTYHVMAEMPRTFEEEGIASWYGKKFHGRRTSSGEPYDMYKLTAAHRELPIPAYVHVTNLDNGRELVVRVNDRGPFARNRIIDLSYAAAQRLDMVDAGVAPVRIELLHADDDVPAVADSGDGVNEAGGNVVQASAAERLPGEVEEATGNRGSNGDPRYFLQAGAFSERGNAERLKERLHQARFDEIRIDNAGDGGLYRVQLGPVSSVEAVDQLSRELEDHGITASRVVIEP